MADQLRIAVLGPSKSGKSIFIQRFGDPPGSKIEPEVLTAETFPSTTPVETESHDGKLLFVEFPDGDFSFSEEAFDRIVILATRKPELWEPYHTAAKKMVENEHELFLVYSISDAKRASSIVQSLSKDVHVFSSYTGKDCDAFMKELLKPAEERLEVWKKREETKRKRLARRKNKRATDTDGWTKA